jgi:hypothetical protein
MCEKNCTCCKKLLPLDNFYKRSRSRDGHRSICKECEKKQKNDYNHKINALKKEKEKEKFIDKSMYEEKFKKFCMDRDKLALDEQCVILMELADMAKVLAIDKERHIVFDDFPHDDADFMALLKHNIFIITKVYPSKGITVTTINEKTVVTLQKENILTDKQKVELKKLLKEPRF